MAKDDLIQVDSTVKDVTGGGNYRIELDNGVEISARLCGKMKRFKIRVIVGDKVTVGLSPYDPTHGLITFRHKG
jgi:translation initiation factor IF-1